MKISRLGHEGLRLSLAVAILSGCNTGGSQALGPSGNASAVLSRLNGPLLSPVRAHAMSGVTKAVPDHRRSWMAPDVKKQNLLYLSDEEADAVYVYSFRSAKLRGTLTGFDAPQGECVDKAGDVFIANEDTSQVLEYAHGGTSPIATLSDSGQYPVGCSVDPTSGNLAVTNIDTPKGGPGNVAIYAGAKGTPTTYTNASFYYYFFCGYDNAGNLFVDGTNDGSAFEFAELPSKSATLTNVTLNQGIGFPGGVQWDGKHVAVGDQEAPYIYEFTISGSAGTVVHSTPLNNTNDVAQFWIHGSRVVAPDFLNNEDQFFRYPAGGTATKAITGINTPIGSTVSTGK